MRARWSSAVLAAAVLLAGASAQAQDVIKMRDNSDVKGRIVKLDAKGLTYETGGKQTNLTNEQFQDFTLGDPPSFMRDGDKAARANDWDKAISFYATGVGDIDKHPRKDIFKQFLYWNLAKAHRAKKDFDKALAALKSLRKECGDCRLRKDSWNESLDIARGDKAKITIILNEMKSEPEPMKGTAELELAKIQFESNDFKGAKDVFSRLAGNSSQPYAGSAAVWNVRCLKALKETSALESACKSALANRAGLTPSLLQAAAGALGDVLYEKAQSDPKLLREALVAYAQAIAAGPPPAGETPSDYTNALLNAGRSYVKLAGSAKPESMLNYQGRARGYFSELIRFYKNTEWARSAEADLAALDAAGAGAGAGS